MSTYIKFLQHTAELRKKQALPELDPLEERILVYIALTKHDNKRLSVRDLMGTKEFGAPMTIHTRITNMRAKGWVILSDTEDTRRKQVDLSQAALLHFDKLGEIIKQL